MKILIRSIGLAIIALSLTTHTPLSAVNGDSQAGQRIFFSSPPRSGTHWMMYIMQYFSKRLISSKRAGEDASADKCCIGRDHYSFGCDPSKPLIHVRHEVNQFFRDSFAFEPPKRNVDQFVLIVRNPVESAIRSYMHGRGLSYEELLCKFQKQGYRVLVNNLNFYDRWPSERRLLVYYEDLMEFPLETITRIVTFLGESTDLVADFIEHLDGHKTTCLTQYKQSMTQGKDLTYHSRQLSEQQLQRLEEIIKESDIKVWKKYLGRYER